MLLSNLSIFTYFNLVRIEFIKQENEVRDVRWINMDLIFNAKPE